MTIFTGYIPGLYSNTENSAYFGNILNNHTSPLARGMLVCQILEDVKNTLERLRKTLSRYDVRIVDSQPQTEDKTSYVVPTNPSPSPSPSQSQSKPQGVTKRLTNNVRWLAGDQKEAERMILRLKQSNELRQAFVPPHHAASLNYQLMAQSIVGTSDPATLARVHKAAEDFRPFIAEAALVKASRISAFQDQSSTSDSDGTRTVPVPNSQLTKLSAFEWMVATSSPATQQFRYVSLDDAIAQERLLAKYTHKGQGEGMALSATGSRDRLVLVEWRNGFQSNHSLDGKEARLDRLVHAINIMGPSIPRSNNAINVEGNAHNTVDDREHVPSESIYFGLLRCLGWITIDANFSRIGMVFDLPDNAVAGPTSLAERIERDRKSRATAPALGVRFAMAPALLEQVANLVMVGWVHKSIRSDNVLFFDTNGANQPAANDTDPRNRKKFQAKAIPHAELRDLYLTGFSYSRPRDPNSASDLSNPIAHNPCSVLYRPPSAVLSAHRLDALGEEIAPHETRGPDVTSPFNAAFDIYGLGIILLEIGLWNTIESIYSGACRTNVADKDGGVVLIEGTATTSRLRHLSVQDFQKGKYLCGVVDSLKPRVGTIYHDVVLKCLDLDSWADKMTAHEDESPKDVQTSSRDTEFLRRIMAMISECRA